MRAVNLLPKDAGRSGRKAPKPAALLGLVGGTVLVVVLAGLYLTSSSTLTSRQDELAAREAELTAIPRPSGAQPVPADDAELAGERSPRVIAVSAALAERVSWDRVLRRFAQVLPDDVWLQTLALTSPVGVTGAAAETAAADPAAATASQGFTVTGRTYSHEGVARLLARMVALPDLHDVQLQTSSLAELNGQDVVQFTIVAGVRADGESS